MPKKTTAIIFNVLIYTEIYKPSTSNNYSTWKINAYQSIFSLSLASKQKLRSTAFFFKSSAFIVLALNTLYMRSYRKVTMKSTIFSLWNSIAAYTGIF